MGRKPTLRSNVATAWIIGGVFLGRMTYHCVSKMGTFEATPNPRQDVATAAGPMVSAAFLGPCPKPKQTQPDLFAVRAVLGSSLVAIFAVAMYLEARPQSHVESDPHKLRALQMAMASKSGVQAPSTERVEAQQLAHTGILAPSREEASFDVEARAVACVAEAGVEVDVPQAAPRVGVNEATTHSSDGQFAAPDERTVAPRLKRRSSLTQAAAPGGIRAVPIFGPQLSNPRVTSQKSLVRSFAPGDVGITHKSLIQATAPGGISLDVACLGRGQAKGVVVESCQGSPQSPTESATPRRHTAPSGAQAGSLQGGRLMQSTAASRARVSPATGSLKLPPSPTMQMGRTPAIPRTLENAEMLRTLTA